MRLRAYLLGLLQELVVLYRTLYSAKLAHLARTVYDLKLRIIRQNLYGIDIDPFATNIAKLRLWLSLAVDADKPLPLPNLDFKIETGDALLASDAGKPGEFDIVLANPPYVDSHTMVKNQPDYRAALAARFSTAKGAWDLYVPFWERSLQLLAPGGIATLITPNKWLSAGYGKSLRKLSRGMVYQICDCSSFRAFEKLGVASIIVSMKRRDVSAPLSHWERGRG